VGDVDQAVGVEGTIAEDEVREMKDGDSLPLLRVVTTSFAG
jgi:hypothetical protein